MQDDDALKKKLDFLRGKVLKAVKPSEAEIKHFTALADQIMERLHAAAPKDVEIMLAGSVARGTQVRGSSDIDIFLLFPKKLKEREMERVGVGIAKSIARKHAGERIEIKYAEHPYVQLIFDDLGINADIVPAYKISNASEKGSAVDRTQLHNEFVNENLSEYQKDDVRVLKTFLKEHNIYGAEAMVEGFSGYLCELLIYHYGTFYELVRDMARLAVPVAIIPKERVSLNKEDSAAYAKRFNSSFVVIDPTDSNRNVAANVSIESLSRLVLISRRLATNPVSKNFFATRYSEMDTGAKLLKLAKSLDTDMYVLSAKAKDVAEDIIWQQTSRLRLRIEKLLSKNHFEPLLSLQGITENGALIAFFINKTGIGATVHEGPSAFMGAAAKRFLRSHASDMIFLRGDRLAAIAKAEFKTPIELLVHFIRDKREPFPSYLSKRDARIYVNKIDEKHAKILYRTYIEKFNF
ncbi:MAG: CCA tRNA nucleotidyltransferase [Candidatus Marsarchaeota archaeon]|nr:CCA tRNA nucleotidyltransferase [Candidatus Marsarchaeota archaeon]MCL5418384.1 CCA tRNA nucleotidyltransferase [Candidatus Marsarchaeota archaeon]